MAASQICMARCSRVIGSRTAVAPRRAAQPLAARKLVCSRAAKLAEVEANSSTKHEKKAKHEEEEEEEVFESAGDDGLNPQQVESLLSVLCEETDIAEVELKMGSFKMRVRRSLHGGAAAAAAAAPVPVAAPAAAPAPAPAPAPSVASVSTDQEDDEYVLEITANKVGILRRGRYVKGKAVGKGPMVNPGDQVKKGQALAYIEQLGTHWPVEAPQAGEIVDFLVDEGSPVEYKQAVATIAPYFGSSSPGFSG